MARRGGKAPFGDEDFYSSLAAGVSDDSDGSVPDTRELARSFGALDDMEDDILGSLSKKKKPPASQLSKTLPAKSSLAAPSGKKTTPASKDTFNIDDIMGDTGGRPKTTDDTKKSSLSSDLFGDPKPRPATTGQSGKVTKKIDFGDFDEDDPLAGLDLSDDEKPAKPKKAPSRTTVNTAARPATRSGNRPNDDAESQFPIKSRVKPDKAGGNEEGSDWDASSASSTAAGSKQHTRQAKSEPVSKPSASKPLPKKKEAVTFSDDEDDLDLGLDDTPPAKVKEKAEKEASGGIMGSLFGKSSSVEKHLQRPGTGGSGREFNLLDSGERGQQMSAGGGKAERSLRKTSDDDDDVFGSYAPSAVSSRPGTGRSVRFEDEEPSNTQKRPATADAALSKDDDWLGLGTGVDKQKKRPLGLASTIDFSNSAPDDDWLDMASGSSRPKTAPVAMDKKPPRTPDKRPVISGGKIGGADDWLAELTTKVDEETTFTPKPKHQPRTSTDKQFSRQSSIDSVGSAGRRPSMTKQSSADDWLGLGEETPLPAKPMASKPAAKMTTPKPAPVVDDSDWLGLGSSPPTKEAEVDDTEEWIKTAKFRRQKSTDSTLGDTFPSHASGTFSHGPAVRSSAVQRPPWEEGNIVTSPKQAAISSIFDDSKQTPTQPPSRQPMPAVTTLPPSSIPRAAASQLVFQPMFSAPERATAPPSIDASTWNHEQDSLVQQHQKQMEQMQQQFNGMMEVRRRQQQAALEHQRKMAEEAFNLQQQQLQASISGISPSPVFPTGLSPTKQSEIQLNNVELEGKVRRLEHENSHLESLIESMKKRHQEEVAAIDTGSKSRILIVEESYQRRELRLREEIDQLAAENLTKLRHAEEEKFSLLSAQYRKMDELERSKTQEIERMREQHRNEVERMKQDHLTAIDLLRRSKEQELEGLLSTTSNPQSLQFLMEQMKQSAANITAMQFNVGKSHQVTLDERQITMNTRDQQLKVLQECLLKQQDENDKERSRLQELLAKMEIQLREQERHLHQEKWSVSQEKSKLSALQVSVEQERILLTDQLTRERSDLARAKDSLLAEQRQAIIQLADERRLLSEERSQLTISQRVAVDKKNEESIRQTQGSARYEGLIKSLDSEREDLAKRSKDLAANESKMAAEQAALQQEREFVQKEQTRLSELARKIQSEMEGIESFSKECIEQESGGRQALMEARRLESINQARLGEISSRLEELKSAEKRSAEERMHLARERKQMESLKSMQLCAGCKQPVSRNPYFSLSTPILRTRTSPATVGVVSPQQLDLTDPNILQYKIQADQDSYFLQEEGVYLDALKYSPYHNKSVP